MKAVQPRLGAIPRVGMSGFSLTELLVATFLGVLLSLGFVKIYLESLRNYVSEEDMARIQENGRFALDLLGRELALAGFYGGQMSVGAMLPERVSPACSAGGRWSLDLDRPLEFIDDFTASFTTDGGTVFTCLAAGRVKLGTDIFSVKRTAGEPTVSNGVYKDGLTAAEDTQWYLRIKNHGLEQSWFYNQTYGFSSGDIGAGSKVDFWEFYAQIFFIRRYSVMSSDEIPTLCVSMLAANSMDTECLVEGVEDMQLEFGVDTTGDGSPNRFQSEPEASDMANTVAARVSLLLRGTVAIAGYSNRKTYRLGGKAIPARNDAYQRRVMTTTVHLRNAMLRGSAGVRVL